MSGGNSTPAKPASESAAKPKGGAKSKAQGMDGGSSNSGKSKDASSKSKPGADGTSAAKPTAGGANAAGAPLAAGPQVRYRTDYQPHRRRWAASFPAASAGSDPLRHLLAGWPVADPSSLLRALAVRVLDPGRAWCALPNCPDTQAKRFIERQLEVQLPGSVRCSMWTLLELQACCVVALTLVSSGGCES